MKEVKKIGNYTTDELIGQGGMGKIYRAKDNSSKKTVVIKQLIWNNRQSLTKRFEREAELMKDFSHNNIVKVFEIFKKGQSHYIVMEYVDGIALSDLITQKKMLDPLAAVLLFYGICQGIKYAHDRGVVHRDIKPDNILISKNGEVKILDFGIASARPDKDEIITVTGAVMGTPAYMSPEQLKDSKHVDKRSDIYSIGVVFYKMLTGVNAFPTAYEAATFQKISKGDYVPPQKLNPQIPAYCIKVLKKTMNNKINKRVKDLKGAFALIQKFIKPFGSPKGVNDAIKTYIVTSTIEIPAKRRGGKTADFGMDTSKSILKEKKEKKTAVKSTPKKPTPKNTTPVKKTTKKETDKKNTSKKTAPKKSTPAKKNKTGRTPKKTKTVKSRAKKG